MARKTFVVAIAILCFGVQPSLAQTNFQDLSLPSSNAVAPVEGTPPRTASDTTVDLPPASALDVPNDFPEIAPPLSNPLSPLGINSLLGSSLGTTRGSRSSMPAMIGDTTAGGCGVLRLNGGLPVASVAHPTFACSRINIAENNSPELRDRFYVSYRYFNEASTISVFPESPTGGESIPDIHRTTIGIERKIADVLSVELRLPINHQLSSDLTFTQQTGLGATDPPRISLPLDDREISFGNIGLIFKTLLWQDDRRLISGGIAINFPTSPDVKLQGFIDDDRFVIGDPTGTLPNFTTAVDFSFDATVRNTLYTLSPFLAITNALNDRWFVQGFAQWDAPLTPLKGSVTSSFALPDLPFFAADVNDAGEIEIQDLMRLNIGVGRYLYRNARRNSYREIAFVTELHYTHTLEEAKIQTIEVIESIGGIVPATNVDVGNIANNVDVLNLVVGLPIRFNRWRLVNGVIVPLREAPDRGFEYELNSMISYDF